MPKRKRQSKKDVFRKKFLNEPFTQDMLDIFITTLSRLEKPYLKNLAKETFLISKKTVPYRSGKLADSATLSNKINYNTGEVFSINYDAPYAWAIHEGKRIAAADLDATGQYPYKAYTKAYTRSDGTPVGPPAESSKTGQPQDGYKLYKKYYKPVKVNGSWASLDQGSIKPAASKWLQKAWDFVRVGEDKLAQRILPNKLRLKRSETKFGTQLRFRALD